MKLEKNGTWTIRMCSNVEMQCSFSENEISRYGLTEKRDIEKRQVQRREERER